MISRQGNLPAWTLVRAAAGAHVSPKWERGQAEGARQQRRREAAAALGAQRVGNAHARAQQGVVEAA